MTVEPSPQPAPASPAVTPPVGTTRRPDERAVFGALYRLLLRSIATPGRIAAIGALALISALTALIVHLNDPSDPLREGTGWVTNNLSSLVAVGVLVFAAASLGDLQDDGTLIYLWLRPIPPRLPVLAAWCATMTVAVPLVGLPVVLSAAMIEPDGGLLAGTALSVLVAMAAYSALFVTAGIRFRRALPWGLAYILLWEGVVASAGAGAGRLAVRSYVRSILAELSGERVKYAGYGLVGGITIPLLVTALALAYAARRLAKTDVA